MRDDRTMRTTLDLDDDVLRAAKELAMTRGKTAGQVVSELLRKALAAPSSNRLRKGVPLLPRRPRASLRPTMAVVNSLRDE